MFEYPLSRAARLRPRSRAMSAQTGFVVMFGLMFFLSGGPATSVRPPRAGPDAAPLAVPVSSTAASAQEVERPAPPPLIRVLDEKTGGVPDNSALWTMALRTDLALDPDPPEVGVAVTPEPEVSIVLPLLPDTPLPDVDGQTASIPNDPPRALPVRPEVGGRGLAAVTGRWIPDTGTCRAASDRTLLPLQISAAAAKAGPATCRFLDTKGERNHWSIVAKCVNGRDRWTANVRLVLASDRLTWTSQRGSQAYRRCPVANVAARR